MAVGRFQGGAEVGAIPIEVHPQLKQSFHAVRGFMNEQLHGGGIAEPCPGLERVLPVAGEAVLGAGHGGDAPLGPAAG